MSEGGTNEATKLLNEMLETGHEPNTYMYNPIIREICKEGPAEKAFTFIRNWTSKGSHRDIFSYNTILRALLDKEKWVEGEKLV